MPEESGSVFTKAVHAGEDHGLDRCRPVSTPIQMSVGYLYETMEEMDRVFGGEECGYVYPRYGSPTVAAFERAVAHLEGTNRAVAYASGMAAMHAALLGAGALAGSTVVCASDVYGATYALVGRVLRRQGVTAQFVNIADLDEVRRALAAHAPVAVVCETVSNPLLRVADIPCLAEAAHDAGARLIVDSTFTTPYLLQPLAMGADYVVHSATKYLSGHGDVMAGIVACSAETATDLLERQKILGTNLGPQEAWLALRGIKTLALRVREQCRNAQVIAEWLTSHPCVEKVNYPGLSSHPQHALAKTLFGGRGFGGMISFDLKQGTPEKVYRFMEALELVLPATTLGDVYSLVLYPAMSSHRALHPEERSRLGIGDGLVRLSVGIESADDIMRDLDRALCAA